MNKKLVFLILSGFTLLGCHFNREFVNREEDKATAEKTADIFYENVRQENYDVVKNLMSKEFYVSTTKDKWEKVLRKTDSLLGKVESRKLVNWQTIRVEGTDARANYLLQYKVQREKYESAETITLQKEGDSIKVKYYSVNSDGFAQ